MLRLDCNTKTTTVDWLSVDADAEAENLYPKIIFADRVEDSFAVPLTEESINELRMQTLKAQSGNDIALGHPPTLLNAGASTNFTFELAGCNRELMTRVNGIESRSKLKDRLSLLADECEFTFSGVAHKTFERNMRLIDSMFPALMAQAVLRYYLGEGKECTRIAEDMDREDPLGLGKGMYVYKFKKFLCAVALGMTPAKEWDGRDDATGGYVIVRSDGAVLAFHIYNRDMFEDYLLNSARFETASTTRHDFGNVYERNGKYLINLNLQIRFR